MTNNDWEVVIGLEIHAQVMSKSKLMSGAPVKSNCEPNENVSIVDAALPGVLPVVNEECIRQTIRTGISLGCKINKNSRFARKNYFYADLPQGYQISQADLPLVGEGTLQITLDNGDVKNIGIERIHLEQDAGKSMHDQDPKFSYIDLNRSGVGLMEIVSKPDIRSADEALKYFSKIRSYVRTISSCDGEMAKGSMRADVNVSIMKKGSSVYGTRTECKNINSLKFMKQAIEYETKRQIKVLEDGGEIKQETRLFDVNKGITQSMREKENAHDYRYFPDPDLLPIVLDDNFINHCKNSLPELPDDRKKRFIDKFSLNNYDADILVSEKKYADFFEETIKNVKNYKLAANWIISELFGSLKKANIDILDSPVTANNLGELVKFIEQDVISGKIAKNVFIEMFKNSKKAKDIIEEKGLKQITDTGEINTIIDKVVNQNPNQVTSYKENPKLIGWFVGQVMQKTKGKANPAIVNKLLNEKLSNMK